LVLLGVVPVLVASSFLQAVKKVVAATAAADTSILKIGCIKAALGSICPVVERKLKVVFALIRPEGVLGQRENSLDQFPGTACSHSHGAPARKPDM
jgi:hypothetical protein